MNQFWPIFILIAFNFSSCSHFIKTNNPKVSKKESSLSIFYNKLNSSYKSPYGEIPLDNHSDVNKWIKYFTTQGRDHMNSYLERSSRYLPLMKSVLKDNKLPLNLVYVALIESGFSPKALSRSNAVGYWQFIYGTGKRYGLRIDGFVDERKDPILSTQAATNYFKDLYSLFGSWHLALSAYNAGEYRINRAVLKHYNRDFWYLSSKKAFPRETRNYIPKLIAAIHISKNPEKYGFHQLNYQKPIDYELLIIKKSISLLKLAKNIGIPPEKIKRLNPMYKGEYVPIYDQQALIRVPTGSLAFAQVSVEKSLMTRPNHSYHYYQWYRVRQGDNLYKISRRHRTSVRKIRRANKMGSSSFLRIGQKLKIPSSRLIASKKSKNRTLASKSSKKIHVVKKGQNLFSIARTYGLNLSQIKKLNNINGNPTIHPGQSLKLQASNPIKKKNYHFVQRGDTLIGIAKKHNISLPKLMRANSMSFKSVLLTGTRLFIPKFSLKNK